MDALNSEGGILCEGDRVIVVVEGVEASEDLVRLGFRLAQTYAVPWEAIAPVTRSDSTDSSGKIAEALSLAARLGAMVSRLPATTTTDAVVEHVKACIRPHFVIASTPRNALRRMMRSSLADELAQRFPHAVVHVILARASASLAVKLPEAASLSKYISAAAGALLALTIVSLLKSVTGTDYLSLLFLFPVIGAATRLGLYPAVLAAGMSAIGFNILFLAPLRAFDPLAVQTWLMFVVLAGIATYTSWTTGALRNRLNLSDRSAKESAALAAFAQELTRVATWTATAEVVCREFHNLLGLRTLIIRKIDGELQLVSSLPDGASLDPLDKTALAWSWDHAEAAGAGTQFLADASWQFQPLRTSLGVLASLGLARDDGRDPVPADRRVLLETMLAQAALAHERLRFEDRVRQNQKSEFGTD